jgi:polyisoprenoid-binding protein YceI
VSSPETHHLGPANGALRVRTGRTGAVARAGHDLLLEVGAWEATLGLDGAQATLALRADSTSMRVLEGTGGMMELGDDDKAAILQTIGDDVLKGADVEFRSTTSSADADHYEIVGELTLNGVTRPLTFELDAPAGGRLSASAVVKQSDWGIKPYTTLFGALKVADEVAISFEGDPLHGAQF